ncbi:MAG: electron transfer flavoprotein subunit beta/FixA family protein [Deltaproteobacteria bacterium]
MKGIKIVVCVKQIPDPEAPLGAAKVDSDGKRMDVSALRQVINPFDENAVEAALRIKDEWGGQVTVLSMGHKLDASVLRKVLAVGADRLILLDDPCFEDLDTNSTAHALSLAINKLGEYDLVITGRQAGDWDSGQTGIVLGEILGVATVHLARKVKIEDRHAIVQKIVPGGYEVGGLRFPYMKMILLSRRQRLVTCKAEHIELRSENIQKMGIVYLMPPPDLRRQCTFVEGTSPEEKGQNLAIILNREFG